MHEVQTMTPEQPDFMTCLHDVLNTGPLLTAFAEANRPDGVKPGSGVAYLIALVGQDEDLSTGDLARAVHAYNHGNY